MVARLWTSEYVWNAHNRYAVSVGLPADVVEAIRLGKRPANMDKDVEAVYNFANEFLTTRKVSDATFQAAKDGARRRSRGRGSDRHDGAVSNLVDAGGARSDAAGRGREAVAAADQLTLP